MSRLPTRFVLRAAVVLAVALPLAAPSAASAEPAPARHVPLTVMTRNLYLGADLKPALAATTPTEVLVAVARIYGTSLFTSFPTRSAALADEVAAQEPDLVGLQEVSRWTTTGPGTGPSLDYLVILQAQLAARGLHYAVASVSDNADIGPVPLVAPCAGPVGACTVRFEDRDVILVNTARAGLQVGSPRHGTYVAQVVVATPIGPLSFSRGWATVDGTLGGRHFRFADTHLETEDFPAVQEAQALEFLAAVQAPGAVVAVGDFNSAADGSQTRSYAELTADYFRDAWAATESTAGLTCCQNETLTNPVSRLRTRIDLVLTHGVRPLDATVVGATPFEAVPPLWASDHAGLVAEVKLR